MARTRRMAVARMTAPDSTRQQSRRVALERALTDMSTQFEFFQTMRLLMRMYPEKEAVGGWEDPAREVVRLSVTPSLAFPPSEITHLRLPVAPSDSPLKAGGSESRQVQMAIRFLGLTGPQGVLPHVYTEHAMVRTRARDTAFRDFLDLFHHRLLSLFYRAWERHRTAVASERGAEDRVRSHLLDLAGVGTPELQTRTALPVNTIAYYAGLFALRSRPAIGLAQLVSDYFQVGVSVDQFVGDWQPLRNGGQVAIGADDADGMLGMGVIGNAVFDTLSRVRLRVGPLNRAQFDAFLPGGASHDVLCHLARFYADDQAGVEAQLVLAKDQVPAASLGESDAPVLGFGTWLRAKPAARDADDVRLTLC